MQKGHAKVSVLKRPLRIDVEETSFIFYFISFYFRHIRYKKIQQDKKKLYYKESGKEALGETMHGAYSKNKPSSTVLLDIIFKDCETVGTIKRITVETNRRKTINKHLRKRK